MNLADPFQAILFACAAGTFLAAFRTRVAATLFAWWAIGMGWLFVFGEVSFKTATVMDATAAVLVFLCMRRAVDSFILVLFFYPIVIRFVGDAEIDWRVSWAVGVLQMVLAMIGAFQEPVAALNARLERERDDDDFRFVRAAA